MEIKKKKLDGLFELVPEAHRDDRGFLARIYEERVFQKFGLPTHWTEESHHHTDRKHIVRGLYVQRAPHSEGKLLRAIRGEMLWVSVDVRKGSKTFGEWDTVVLSEKEKNILITVRGFAHGCISLTDDVDLLIQSDNYFSAENGVGIVWNDPDLAIDWRLGGTAPFVSERDRAYPTFAALKKKYPNGIDA